MAKMLAKEGLKIDGECRKMVALQFGFKHTYAYNWKEQNGFFFFLNNESVEKNNDNILYVKPLYCDKIWRLAFNNGGENMSKSSSANMCSQFNSPSIALGVWKSIGSYYYRAEQGSSREYWINIFTEVDKTIKSFLEVHPCAETFFPAITNRDNLLIYIFCLINSGEFQEAKKKIKELRKSHLPTEDILFWHYHSKRFVCRKLRRMLFYNSLFHRDQKAMEVLHNWAIKIPIIKKYIPPFKPYTEPLFTIKQYQTFYKKCYDIIVWSMIGSMGLGLIIAIIVDKILN